MFENAQECSFGEFLVQWYDCLSFLSFAYPDHDDVTSMLVQNRKSVTSEDSYDGVAGENR